MSSRPPQNVQATPLPVVDSSSNAPAVVVGSVEAAIDTLRRSMQAEVDPDLDVNRRDFARRQVVVKENAEEHKKPSPSPATAAAAAALLNRPASNSKSSGQPAQTPAAAAAAARMTAAPNFHALQTAKAGQPTETKKGGFLSFVKASTSALSNMIGNIAHKPGEPLNPSKSPASTLALNYNTKSGLIYPIFGVELKKIHAFMVEKHIPTPLEKEFPGLYLPKQIITIFDYIIANSAGIEGIFRISGDSVEISTLKKRMDNGEELNIPQIGSSNIHNLTGLLKSYWRSLPEPLFPFSFYSRLLDAYDQKNNKSITEIPHQSFPIPNSMIFIYLFTCLSYIERGNKINKMTANNLAIVFAPNIIRPQVETMQSAITDTAKQIAVVAMLIEEYVEKRKVKDIASGYVAPRSSLSTPGGRRISGLKAANAALAQAAATGSPSAVASSVLSDFASKPASKQPNFPAPPGGGPSRASSANASSTPQNPAVAALLTAVAVATGEAPAQAPTGPPPVIPMKRRPKAGGKSASIEIQPTSPPEGQSSAIAIAESARHSCMPELAHGRRESVPPPPPPMESMDGDFEEDSPIEEGDEEGDSIIPPPPAPLDQIMDDEESPAPSPVSVLEPEDRPFLLQQQFVEVQIEIQQTILLHQQEMLTVKRDQIRAQKRLFEQNRSVPMADLMKMQDQLRTRQSAQETEVTQRQQREQKALTDRQSRLSEKMAALANGEIIPQPSSNPGPANTAPRVTNADGHVEAPAHFQPDKTTQRSDSQAPVVSDSSGTYVLMGAADESKGSRYVLVADRPVPNAVAIAAASEAAQRATLKLQKTAPHIAPDMFDKPQSDDEDDEEDEGPNSPLPVLTEVSEEPIAAPISTPLPLIDRSSVILPGPAGVPPPVIKPARRFVGSVDLSSPSVFKPLQPANESPKASAAPKFPAIPEKLGEIAPPARSPPKPVIPSKPNVAPASVVAESLLTIEPSSPGFSGSPTSGSPLASSLSPRQNDSKITKPGGYVSYDFQPARPKLSNATLPKGFTINTESENKTSPQR